MTDDDARPITEYIDGNADTISHILDKTKAIELTEPKIKSLVSIDIYTHLYNIL